MSMTTAQLAAVSFLARYAGHTHELYSYQLPDRRLTGRNANSAQLAASLR